MKKNIGKDFTTEELLKIINDLPKKVKIIDFFGGEPLLRPDLLILIKKAKEMGFKTMINSNGYLLDENMVKNLKSAGLDVMEVSIDSANPKIHNELRRKEGVFERAVSGIKYCLKENISCNIATYATKESIKNSELKKIISLGKELGVSLVKILSPIMAGKWLNENTRLDENDRKELKRLLRFGFAFLEDENCYVARKTIFYISPYGDVQPCTFVPITFGNIKNESLEKILKKMFAHPMYKIKTRECIMNNPEFRKKCIKEIESGVAY